MKSFVAVAAGLGLLGIGAFAAVPAMAGITADQEAAQLDEPAPSPSVQQNGPQAVQVPTPSSPYAFNGSAQERIANAPHFGNADQLPRSAAELP